MAQQPQPVVFGPYSPIRQMGDLYFTAGQVGVDPITLQAEPGAREQMVQAIANLVETLASVGLTLDDVVKVTLFLTDLDDAAEVNEVYMQHFQEPRPARSTIGVKELPRIVADTPLKVEIEAVAAKAGRP